MQNTTAPVRDVSDVPITELDAALNLTKGAVFAHKTAAVFLSSLLCKKPIIWDPAQRTCGTDGKAIFWNPDWFLRLDEQARRYILVSQLWYIGLLCIPRRQNRNRQFWNLACEYWMHQHMAKQGYEHPGVTVRERHDLPAGATIEQIYDFLVDEFVASDPDMTVEQLLEKEASTGYAPHAVFQPSWVPTDGGPAVGAPIQPGEIFPKYNEAIQVQDDLSQEENTAAVRDILDTMVSTSLIMDKEFEPEEALTGGDEPGHVSHFIKQFLAPKVAWEKEISQFMQGLIAGGRSFARPNRRYSAGPVILPSVGKIEGALDKVLFYQDSSGSVTDDQNRRFSSEAKYVHKTFKPKEMGVIQFDTRISDEIYYGPNDNLEYVQIVGGGGTSLRCVREHIIQHQPTAVVIMTDGQVEPMEDLDKVMAKPPVILWVILDGKGRKLGKGKHIYVSTAHDG